MRKEILLIVLLLSIGVVSAGISINGNPENNQTKVINLQSPTSTTSGSSTTSGNYLNRSGDSMQGSLWLQNQYLFLGTGLSSPYLSFIPVHPFGSVSEWYLGNTIGLITIGADKRFSVVDANTGTELLKVDGNDSGNITIANSLTVNNNIQGITAKLGSLNLTGNMSSDNAGRNELIDIGGIQGYIPINLFTQTERKLLRNHGTFTSSVGNGVGTLTVPTSAFVPGASFRYISRGYYSVNATAMTFGVNLTLNNATLFTNPVSMATAPLTFANRSFQFYYYGVVVNESGVIKMIGQPDLIFRGSTSVILASLLDGWNSEEVNVLIINMSQPTQTFDLKHKYDLPGMDYRWTSTQTTLEKLT